MIDDEPKFWLSVAHVAFLPNIRVLRLHAKAFQGTFRRTVL